MKLHSTSATALYEQHVDMVYRMCLLCLRNAADAEDAAQTVFLKALQHERRFRNAEHAKAWLIRTARNQCLDRLKRAGRNREQPLDDERLPLPAWEDEAQGREVLRSLLALPETYKTVLYLYYYEAYSVKALSRLLGRKQSTIQTQLARGRARLKLDLGGNFLEESTHQ